MLDRLLIADPDSRSIIEILLTDDKVTLAGTIRSQANLTLEALDQVVRDTVKKVGFDHEGFSWRDLALDNITVAEGADIAMGVDRIEEMDIGSGDSFSVQGYATHETDALLPAPITYAQRVIARLRELRVQDTEPFFGPDSTCQVGLRYNDVGLPTGIGAVTIVTQHNDHITAADLRDRVMEDCIHSVFPVRWIDESTSFHINPTGRFVVGGPVGYAGVTGHQIASHTYGGLAQTPEGLVSGRDPTKLNRSAAYFTRYLAKNIVAAGLAKRCSVQLTYAIGVAEPIAIGVHTHGTGRAPEAELEQFIRQEVDCRPRAIIARLDLRRPIYQQSVLDGAFGNPDANWERTDLAVKLRDHKWSRVSVPVAGAGSSELMPNTDITLTFATKAGAENAAAALLSFFKDILDAVSPSVGTRVAVERLHHAIRMGVTVPDRDPADVMDLFDHYTQVLSGALSPTEAYDNRLIVARLESKIDEAKSMLRTEQRFRALDRQHHREQVRLMERLIESEKEKTDLAKDTAIDIESATRHAYKDVIASLTQTLERTQQSHDRFLDAFLARETHPISDETSALLATFQTLVAQQVEDDSEVPNEQIIEILKQLSEQDPSTFKKIRDMVLSGAIQVSVGNSIWAVLSSIPWGSFL